MLFGVSIFNSIFGLKQQQKYCGNEQKKIQPNESKTNSSVKYPKKNNIKTK